MKKRKICVVVTARPSYARIKTALEAIGTHPELELQLVVAASAVLERYGEALKYIRADGFDVRATVYMVLEGENLVTSAKSTGLGMIERPRSSKPEAGYGGDHCGPLRNACDRGRGLLHEHPSRPHARRGSYWFD